MHRLSLAATAALLLTGAVACSDSTSPSASDAFQASVNADLAPTAGDEVASTYDFYATASATSTGASFTRIAPGAGVSASISVAPPRGSLRAWISPQCTYNSSSEYFDCPTLQWGNYSLNVSYGLFDATGASQSAYNDTTTASVNIIAHDTGAVLFTWNSNSYADTSSRHRDATVSNLEGTPDTLHIWNATGSSSVHSVRSGQITRDYRFSSNDTTIDLAMKQPAQLNPYPLSGTIIRNYTVTRTRSASDTTTRTATRRVVVTFNGTANVPMTVGSSTFTLNLDTHRVH